MLDEFQATSISQQPKPAATEPVPSGPGRPAAATTADAAASSKNAIPSEDEFAKDLQASMSNLINELDQNPDMQKEFEKMMQELIAAGGAPTDSQAAEHMEKAADAVLPPAPAGTSTSKPAAPAAAAAAGSSKKAGSTEDKFQDTIRRTMERMQASGDAATAASTSAKGGGGEDALFEQMMAGLLDGASGGGEGDFNAMLMNMMAQLTHKDILYEPMKELHDKFPDWMTTHAATTSKEDLARFQKQQTLVGEIVARFERAGYSDDNEADREYIVERMQEMQSAGSPPEDLVGDMAAAQEALGDLESGCPTQ